MQIKQDPITKLWCREDGAVLMPPSRGPCKAPRHTYEWVSGCANRDGYLTVWHQRKNPYVHRIIARAFLPNPDNLPTVDHIDMNPANNAVDNLRWADMKTQNNNRKNSLNRAGRSTRVREYHMTPQAAYAAKKQAAGLSYRKGPNGKFGWFPRVHLVEEVANAIA